MHYKDISQPLKYIYEKNKAESPIKSDFDPQDQADPQEHSPLAEKSLNQNPLLGSAREI